MPISITGSMDYGGNVGKLVTFDFATDEGPQGPMWSAAEMSISAGHDAHHLQSTIRGLLFGIYFEEGRDYWRLSNALTAEFKTVAPKSICDAVAGRALMLTPVGMRRIRAYLRWPGGISVDLWVLQLVELALGIGTRAGGLTPKQGLDLVEQAMQIVPDASDETKAMWLTSALKSAGLDLPAGSGGDHHGSGSGSATADGSSI